MELINWPSSKKNLLRNCLKLLHKKGSFTSNGRKRLKTTVQATVWTYFLLKEEGKERLKVSSIFV